MGGAATVLTWRVLLNMLLGAVRPARTLAFLLSTPLTVLGIYCVFPHPFYDCDCTFAIVVCILLLQRLERRGFPPLPAFFTGASAGHSIVCQAEYGSCLSGKRGSGTCRARNPKPMAAQADRGATVGHCRSGRRTAGGSVSNSVNRRSGQLHALDNSVRPRRGECLRWRTCLPYTAIQYCFGGWRRCWPGS